MPEVAENPFTPPLPGVVDSGEPQRTVADVAAEAARVALHGETPPVGAAAPGTEFKKMGTSEAPLVSEESQHVALQGTEVVVLTPEEQAAAATIQAAATTTPAATPEAGTALAFTTERYNELVAQGVNLPIAPADVPAEFLGIYADMVQSATNSFHSQNQQNRDAQEAIATVEDFKVGLSTPEGQERMLLTMAMNNPDIFQKAIETVNRMGEDPAFNENVRLRMEAEIKMEAANRVQAAHTAAAQKSKGQQIESRTVYLANKLGLDQQTAMNEISHRILQNKENYGKVDISFEEVDLILQSLAQRSQTRVPQAVVTPQTAAQIPQAPVTPGQTGVTPTPTADGEANRPLFMKPGETADPRDALRNAVRTSSERIRSTGL